MSDYAPELVSELQHWLDQQTITSDNIGMFRHRCMLPFSSQWNAIVREETAARENKPQINPQPEQQPLGTLK